MEFKVSAGEKYQTVLDAEISVEEMAAALRIASKKVSAKVNIPGFRKGKVPQSVLENYVGIETLLNEAADEVMGRAYVEGIREHDIQPVDKPEIEITQLEKDQPFLFKAIVTVRPEVQLGQYKELPLIKKIYQAEDEDIDADLNSQRERVAKLVDVPADAIAMDKDVVNISFAGYLNGEAFEGGTAENYALEIGSKTFIPGFEEQLLGMSVGEEKNVNVTFPEDYQQEKLAGQPVVFEVKMNGIKRKELPVLDDEFAKEISETADTLAELREETRNRLEEQAMANANIVCQKEAIKMAVDKAEMDIPPVMIEHKMDDIVKRMEDQLAMSGLTMEAFLEYTKNTREDLRESYQEQAGFDVRQDLVLEEIIKAESIEVTEEEITKELEALAARYWQPAEKIRESLEQNGQINNLIFSIKMMKAGDLIFDTAVITEEFITKDTEKTTKKAKKEKKLKV